MLDQRKRIGVSLGVVFLLWTLMSPMGGCSCPGPDNIGASPDCPGGTKAAATLVINVDLSTIRPLGGEKQLRIRGTRGAEEDLCFQPGAEVSFVEIIEGTGEVTRSVTNLAHAGWSVEITALSGGNQQPVTLSRVFPPGSTQTLSISGNAAGDLTATF